MESAAPFFSDGLGLDDGIPPYSDTTGRDKGLVYGQQHLRFYKDKLLAGESPMLRTSKPQTPRSAMWARIGEQDERDGPGLGNQQLFVDPRLYGGDAGNPMVSAPQNAETTSTTPESMRRTSSLKSESRRTSKSDSSSTDITPPDHPPPDSQPLDHPQPKKRKPRRTKKGGSNTKDEEKRVKFLERNRVAASKCREKKKLYVSELEETKIGLESQHAQLQLEYNRLLTEVSGLKHRLMAHAKCNDPNIDSWLSNEARRFVQTTNDLFGSSYEGQEPPSDTPHTRNPSTASSHQSAGSSSLENAPERRDSVAYSQGPSLQTSPTDMVFPPLWSPKPKAEMGMNYDHMPDNLFTSEQ